MLKLRKQTLRTNVFCCKRIPLPKEHIQWCSTSNVRSCHPNPISFIECAVEEKIRNDVQVEAKTRRLKHETPVKDWHCSDGKNINNTPGYHDAAVKWVVIDSAPSGVFDQAVDSEEKKVNIYGRSRLKTSSGLKSQAGT